MKEKEVKQTVKKAYAKTACQGGSCCVAGALRKQDYLNKTKQAEFKVKIISEDRDISETQHGGIALESLKIEATK